MVDESNTSQPSDFSTQEELRTFIEAKFPVQQQVVEVGPFQFDFLSVANPHDNMDCLMGEHVDGDYQWEPFWAQAWPSAQQLANWMLEQKIQGREDWTRMRVLDLGCGVGLNGCVAAAKNAKVTFADYAAPSLLFARYNSWPWRHHVECCELDWHKDVFSQSFDVILGADIVYEQRNWDALNRFFKLNLRSKGEIWLTEPGRDTGEDVQPYLESQGWNIFASTLGELDNGRPLRLLVLRAD